MLFPVSFLRASQTGWRTLVGVLPSAAEESYAASGRPIDKFVATQLDKDTGQSQGVATTPRLSSISRRMAATLPAHTRRRGGEDVSPGNWRTGDETTARDLYYEVDTSPGNHGVHPPELGESIGNCARP